MPLDKPAGPTSHDLVAMARRVLRTRRVGHAGTLDPFATGLLLLLVGKATRLAPFLVGLPKSYRGVIRLGAATDTDDATGAVLSESEAWRSVTTAALREAMAALTGAYAQEPPQFSAKKVGGVAAYRKARRGEAVDLAGQAVDVSRFALLEQRGADVEFEADVSSGTYVRSLGRDLGRRLGCGAHVTALRRTAVGPFALAEAATAEALQQGAVTLRPMLDAVRHLPRVALDVADRERVRHGNPVSWDGDASGPVALVADGQLVAVAEPAARQLAPKVVVDE